jgi:hypothetical protein
VDEFAAKTLRLLRLARAALIYLSLSVHAEERLRNEQNTKQDAVVIPMPLGQWDDDWKRGDF